MNQVQKNHQSQGQKSQYSHYIQQKDTENSQCSFTSLNQQNMQNLMKDKKQQLQIKHTNRLNKQERMSIQFKSRKNIEPLDCQCGCLTCKQGILDMLECVRLANKEVEYLKFMLNFKDIGLEKRDIMLNKYMEQMTQLHEDIKALKMTNSKLQSKINRYEAIQQNSKVINSELPKNSRTIKSSSAFQIRKSSVSSYNSTQNQESNIYTPKQDQIISKRATFDCQESIPKIEFKVFQDQNQISQLPSQQRQKQNSIFSSDKQDNIDLLMQKQISTPKKQINTPRNSLSVSGFNKNNSRRVSISSHSISVQNVTNTQGRQDDEALFRNDFDTNSLMDKGEQDLLTNRKLLFLEQFFESHTKFYSEIVDMNEIQQKQLVQMVNLAISDLKRFFQTSLKYKQLLNVTNEIAKYTTFEHAFDLILKKICTHLKCDTASIFLVDFRTSELWTIGNKTGATIRFPMTDKSIAGYCYLNYKLFLDQLNQIIHEIAMNVFDAYEDPRFNKQIDIDTGYRTKTILCVPIKDEKNQVVGCLEAINKFNEFFHKSDQEMLELMGAFCSSILRNSLKFDKLLLQRDYFKKLIQLHNNIYLPFNEILFNIEIWKIQIKEYFLQQIQNKMSEIFSEIKNNKIGNFISDNTEIDKMMIEGEEKMKELIGSDQCYIYIVKRDKEEEEEEEQGLSIIRYAKEKKEPIQISNLQSSIILQVIKTQKIQHDQVPQENVNYDSLIDINTNLPLITVPIFNKNYSSIIALFQAENVKGFLQKHFGKDEDFQNSPESLFLYGEMIGNAILKHKFYQDCISQVQKNISKPHH